MTYASFKYEGDSLIGAVLQYCPAPLNWNIQRISLDSYTANLISKILYYNIRRKCNTSQAFFYIFSLSQLTKNIATQKYSTQASGLYINNSIIIVQYTHKMQHKSSIFLTYYVTICNNVCVFLGEKFKSLICIHMAESLI